MKTMRQRGLMFRIVVLVMVLSLFPLSFPASADNIIESSPAGIEEREEVPSRVVTQNETEYNNTMTTADWIEEDDTTYGRIAYSGDVDWYKIMFESGGEANFWIGDIPAGKDYDLFLYDASGNVLISSTSNNADRLQELIGSYPVVSNAWYYVKVIGYSCYDVSSYYQLRVKRVTMYETEPNNIIPNANRVYDGDTTYGKIGISGDIDCFKIRFSHSGKANFWLGNIPSGKNYDLYLYDSNGYLLDSSTSNNTARAQELIENYPVTANVWYNLEVVGDNCYDNSTYYQLRAKCYLIREIEILYDTTTMDTKTVAELNTDFDDATAAFASRFGVKFKRESTDAWSALNGSSCPNTSNDSICNGNCGSNVNCRDTHHKSASRLLNIPYSTTTTSTHTCRIVGHRICFYDVDDDPQTSDHREAYGMAHSYGEAAIGLHSVVTTKSANFKCTIQHELTHNLTNAHGHCTPAQPCVLEGDIGEWCENCTNAIISRR